MSVTNKTYFEFDESLFKSESAESVAKLEAWRTQYPTETLTDWPGRTILMMAVMHNNQAICERMMSEYKDPWYISLQDEAGQTAVHYLALATHSVDAKDKEIEKMINIGLMLVKKGADINAKIKAGNTALGYLVANRHDIISSLFLYSDDGNFVTAYRELAKNNWSMIKFFVALDGKWAMNHNENLDEVHNHTGKILKLAQAAVKAEKAAWEKMRLLYIGFSKPDSSFSDLPSDLIHLLSGHLDSELELAKTIEIDSGPLTFEDLEDKPAEKQE